MKYKKEANGYAEISHFKQFFKYSILSSVLISLLQITFYGSLACAAPDCGAVTPVQIQNTKLTEQEMKDIKKIKENCYRLLCEKYKKHSQAAQYLKSQSPDGSWKDIDYADQNRSGWDPSKHLYRLRWMAAAWNDPKSSLHHNERLGNGIKKGIDFWTKEKRIAANWWWNEIFVPMTSGHIFILANDLLQEEQWLKKILPSLEQAKFNYSAQNRIWCATGVLYRGILTLDPALISGASKEFIAEIGYAKMNEGVRVDASYHAHGPQLQFGNYGLSYMESISELILYFSGTKWALKEIDSYRDFVINGMNWILWKDVMDLSAMGRQLNKDQQIIKNKFVRSCLARLAKADPAYADAYKKIPYGNKMFFKSDFMVHRTKHFYASCRANSLRVGTVETCINSDNLLGRYLADGMIQVMRTGKEYLNIAGCWSWTRLPGTTLPDTPRYTEEESRKRGLVQAGGVVPKVSHDVDYRWEGESTFTGGVSDGRKYGAMIYTMDIDRVKANKAVFFANDIIIALGSGIDSTSPFAVATTVEQSLRNGEIQTGDNWYFHNGIGYSGKNMKLFTGLRKGDWEPIWGGYKEPQPDEKDIFQLTIEHGTGVQNGTYEYAIYPDTTAEKMPEMIQSSYQVLENSRTLQAVKLKDGTVMAVFHKPGRLGDFTTDSPGVFIIGKKQIYAADPAQKKRIFNVTLKNKSYKLALPGGQFAGSTVSTAL